jgi:hypothetical protein
LPTPPIELDRAASAWTGRELIVIGGPSTPFRSAVGVALDPQTRQWRRIADLPSDMFAQALSIDWDGTRIVAANYDMEAATYDPDSDRWTKLPSVPARFYEWYPAVRSAGDFTAVVMGQAVVILSADNTWVPLPSANLPWGPIATAQSNFRTQADHGVLFVWETDGDQNALHAIDIDRLIERPSEIQVGAFTLALPDGWSIRSTQYDESDEFAQTVRVTIGSGADECRLASGPTATAPRESVTIDDSRNGLNWRRNAASTRWLAEFSTTDTVTVDCDTSRDARAMVEGVAPPGSD